MSWLIRVQADDFFNAHKVLEKDFRTTNLSVLGPSIVCLAFSVELYLKDLYSALNVEAPKEHDIYKLFDGLPTHVKERIFNHEAVSQNPFMVTGDIFSTDRFNEAYTPYLRFIDQMKTISNGFKTWRYSYEQTSVSYDSSFATALIKAVKSVTDGTRVQPPSSQACEEKQTVEI